MHGNGGPRPTLRSMRYAILIESTAQEYSAYVPDLPGCIAAARTADEARNLLATGVAMHVRGMQEDGEAVPIPSTTAGYIDIGAPQGP